MFRALHLAGDLTPDISFATREEAETYILDKGICESCKGDGEYEGLSSPCAAEWLVVPEGVADTATTLGELFEGAGFVRVDMTAPKGEGDTNGEG